MLCVTSVEKTPVIVDEDEAGILVEEEIEDLCGVRIVNVKKLRSGKKRTVYELDYKT